MAKQKKIEEAKQQESIRPLKEVFKFQTLQKLLNDELNPDEDIKS